jgi:threonyl-tRNA synthetase
MEWINYIVVIGQREIDSGILAVRDRMLKEIRKMRLQDLTGEITQKTTEKPYRALTLPKELSKHPQF